MNSVFEYLCLRKPRLDYISPPICCDFSGSGFPVIVLDPFGRILAPTGLILGGEGNLTLSWDPYFGALCFNIYQAVDENNLEGEYILIAECVEGNSFQLPESGGYKISVITVDGESELSTVIVATGGGGGGGCTLTIQVVGLNPISGRRRALSNNGTVIGGFSGGARPGYFFNGITKDTRTVVNSAPIEGSQNANTVDVTAPFFTPADVNKVLRFASSDEAQISAVLSNIQVTANPSQIVAQTTFELRGNTLGGALGTGLVCNSAGVLAGTEADFSGISQAFWLNTLTNEIRALGAGKVPWDINSFSFLLLDNGSRTEIYNPELGTFTDLGLIEVGSQTTPIAFNDSLVAAVNCTIALPFSHNTACRWAGGALTSIHPAEAGDNSSFCVAINSSGHITGRYLTSPASPFSTFVNLLGASFSTGNFGGEIEPNDINNSATVVGIAEAGSEFIPFVWSIANGLQAIPLLPGRAGGEANAINSAGWIVGEQYGSGADVAFLFRNGVTTRLTDLLPANSGWTELRTAQLVNDNKQIAGFGIHETFGFSAYLLTLCI